MSEFTWPQKGKKLFIEGGNYHEFSHFGWGDIETHFLGYMEGYKCAADELIENAINSRDIKTLDTFIFPICFLYRQYIELSMKYIFLYYSGMKSNEKTSTIKNVGHNLMKIWRKMKPLILEDTSDKEREDVETVEGYIIQFDEFDKSSFTFRYPITKDLKGVLSKEMRINLVNLKECIDELHSFFNGCIGKLDAIAEFKAEMLSEYFENYEYY